MIVSGNFQNAHFLLYQRVKNKNPPLMSATCHFWVVSESDLRVKNKHPLKFKKKRHMKKIGAPKAREKMVFGALVRRKLMKKINIT